MTVTCLGSTDISTTDFLQLSFREHLGRGSRASAERLCFLTRAERLYPWNLNTSTYTRPQGFQNRLHPCCWVLRTPLGEGMRRLRRHSINDIDMRTQVKGKQQTYLLSKAESRIYPPPSIQALSWSGDIVWSSLIGPVIRTQQHTPM